MNILLGHLLLSGALVSVALHVAFQHMPQNSAHQQPAIN